MNRMRLAGFAVLAACAQPAAAETIIGLRESNLNLISFDSATPGTLSGNLDLQGFPAGVVPVAVDYRPATGGLILVAEGPTAGQCRLYGVNTETGTVTAIGTTTYSCPTGAEDVDIDPSTDRVRVMIGAENYRVDPATGTTTADTAAAFAVGDANAGDVPVIEGVAHNQNTAGTGTTTVFAIETGNDVLVRVGSVNGNPTSPSSGELTTIGALGVSIAAPAPFDVSGASATAYLFTYDAGGQRGLLHTVNLTSGAASAGVRIGTGSLRLLGLTVAPGIDLPVPIDEEFGTSGLGAGALALLGLAALVRRRAQRWQRGQ